MNKSLIVFSSVLALSAADQVEVLVQPENCPCPPAPRRGFTQHYSYIENGWVSVPRPKEKVLATSTTVVSAAEPQQEVPSVKRRKLALTTKKIN